MHDVDFESLFTGFARIKVAVIGDVMLDTYWWGKVDRISPEAPVPIVSLTSKDNRLGGAANVALNLKAFDCNVNMFSVIGDDDDGKVLLQRFGQEGINTSGLIKSPARVTTNKSRIMSRNQQMLRLDSEITQDLSTEDEDRLLQAVEEYVTNERPQVLVFEDYNKGVLTARVITAVIRLCQQHNVLTTVDPKHKNFFTYKDVAIFKPNLKEVKEALGLQANPVTLAYLQQIHAQLTMQLGHRISLITLSENGVFYNEGASSNIIPTHIRNISDVSGAGDTVIAVASLVYATTRNVVLMAEVANIAGGLVCEEVGTVAINRERLLEECKMLL
jgi:rfaE bifunctional protein kinase chain/domain